MVVELPELEGSTLTEFELRAPAEGEIAARADEDLAREALQRVVAELDESLERPYETLVVRKDAKLWSAGARAVRAGADVELPHDLTASSVEVVRTPDGELQAQVDGEPIDPAENPVHADAVAELDRRGRERFESFVVRADRGVGGSWQVTVDPL